MASENLSNNKNNNNTTPPNPPSNPPNYPTNQYPPNQYQQITPEMIPYYQQNMLQPIPNQIPYNSFYPGQPIPQGHLGQPGQLGQQQYISPHNLAYSAAPPFVPPPSNNSQNVNNNLEEGEFIEVKHNSRYNLNPLLCDNILQSDYFKGLNCAFRTNCIGPHFIAFNGILSFV